MTLADFGTKSFARSRSARHRTGGRLPHRRIPLRDHPRRRSKYLGRVAYFEESLSAQAATCRGRANLPPARSGAHAALHGGRRKRRRWPRAPSRDKAIDAVRDYFYRGEIAQRSTNSARPTAACCATKTWRPSTCQPEEAVSTTFHGYTVYKPGFWSQGPAMIEALNILEGFDLVGQMRLQFRRVHPHPGGGAEAGLCRPRHLLRRSQVQSRFPRNAALEGVWRGAAQADRATTRRSISGPARLATNPPQASLPRRHRRVTRSTQRSWRRTPPAWTPSTRTAWRSRSRPRARGCRR